MSIRSTLIQTIKNAIEEKKGESIIAIDMRESACAIADFFIICEAKNIRQTKAISDFIDETLTIKLGISPLRIDGEKEAEWIILDYGDVMIHVMTKDHRQYYNLEELWIDMKQADLSSPTKKKTAKKQVQ